MTFQRTSPALTTAIVSALILAGCATAPLPAIDDTEGPLLPTPPPWDAGPIEIEAEAGDHFGAFLIQFRPEDRRQDTSAPDFGVKLTIPTGEHNYAHFSGWAVKDGRAKWRIGSEGTATRSGNYSIAVSGEDDDPPTVLLVAAFHLDEAGIIKIGEWGASDGPGSPGAWHDSGPAEISYLWVGREKTIDRAIQEPLVGHSTNYGVEIQGDAFRPGTPLSAGSLTLRTTHNGTSPSLEWSDSHIRFTQGGKVTITWRTEAGEIVGEQIFGGATGASHQVMQRTSGATGTSAEFDATVGVSEMYFNHISAPIDLSKWGIEHLDWIVIPNTIPVTTAEPEVLAMKRLN